LLIVSPFACVRRTASPTYKKENPVPDQDEVCARGAT
jgi:hypothetical protein